MLPDKLLLYLRPEQGAAPTPLIDRATRKMAAAFRAASPSNRFWRGIHESCRPAVEEALRHILSEEAAARAIGAIRSGG